MEDSRLVVLNARDAELRGAQILTRTKVLSAERDGENWRITTEDTRTGTRRDHLAKAMVNAGGPWVEDVIRTKIRLNSTEGVRLVRGSHIVTRKLYDHDKCYFFQGEDGRIIFAIPYERDFTLIGTTDQDHEGDPKEAECTDEEADYLCDFASKYFATPVTRDDVVWRYSGVRPLYDDGAKSATAATRDYVLSLDTAGAPVLHVFGGKITTYRTLAEGALAKLQPHVVGMGQSWTARVPLPGGDFPVAAFDQKVAELAEAYPFLGEERARRMVRAYGTDAWLVLDNAGSEAELGHGFGAGLTEAEVRWLMDREYAVSAEDIVWRRSKLGLRMTADEIAALDVWMRQAPVTTAAE